MLGAGAWAIGLALKRMDAKTVLYVVAAITFIVAFLMAPFAWVLKGILIAAVIAIVVFYAWRNREALGKAS